MFDRGAERSPRLANHYALKSCSSDVMTKAPERGFCRLYGVNGDCNPSSY